MEVGHSLPSENAIARDLQVSRTVVRGVLDRLSQSGIIHLNGREKTIQRAVKTSDYMEEPSTLLSIDELENRFFDWVLRMDVPPGTVLNVAQIAKDFHVATHTLQEFLSSLSRYGIVKRRPRGGWLLEGFTESFALELSEFRSVLELNAVRHLANLPADHAVWGKLAALEQDHMRLLSRIESDYHDFSKLDETFHFTVNSVVDNRFVREFQKIISLIFHYHFQWNKEDERTRNEAAIHEHLDYIEALRSRDVTRAEKAAKRHLGTSAQTLVRSLKAHDHLT
ncbi:GntR family transcriptional regulator [Ruegeria sp. 2205SS24-7]|uniref:GntR family transcriptional regulator n=1 Tax=Ruegeria discodermiae TaxID=3064389 RepID=UPI0027403C1B|nr:GntR family transcriptional regulator [Ruegeria sp. 2205SS24-7]MDP5217319.1 GntR family transcriptional regulator [Ruegeria sp. 2205SS24-7]